MMIGIPLWMDIFHCHDDTITTRQRALFAANYEKMEIKGRTEIVTLTISDKVKRHIEALLLLFCYLFLRARKKASCLLQTRYKETAQPATL
jgi:hypothetical protein